ncbi:hypothetical protein MOQ72_36560 [Saccharopolyspora sp. K220]|uniref:hypothetical protein n=1 Tax=Saccharopolyspora soli TaxID=2926618 RepID=UPI001F57E312|nr:hypothetical protein [Saccharopolyspora soli]MCI2422946.1 hypothetical protein [Saccharopolyspora soli]
MSVTEYAEPGRRSGIRLTDGRELVHLDHGRMINLTAANGNPVQAMDLGLTLQARSLACVVTHNLAAEGQPVPGLSNSASHLTS